MCVGGGSCVGEGQPVGRGGVVVVGGGVVHNDNDDTYMTPKGRPDFVALGLKINNVLAK